MVVVVPPPATLSLELLSGFYVVDELLRSPILLLYGPSATVVSQANNSRIQAHIFTAAGFVSYPRLSLSPASPLYSSVNCLPREEQGDEVCRGFAYSLYKYFSDLPAVVKESWARQPSALGSLRSAPALFSDAHAAILAQRMVKINNLHEVIRDVQQALAEQTVSWLDLDVILPRGAMRELTMPAGRDSILPEPSEDDVARHRYGEYAPLVQLFGKPAFLPTSRLKRRPSKPPLPKHSGNFMRWQKENLRREFCELLDTEESYVGKLYDLIHNVAEDFREKARQKSATSLSPGEEALHGLFPPSLDRILEVNSAFLEDLRRVLEETENEAIQDIETTPTSGTIMPHIPERKDISGTLALAACMRSWFPRFAECYTDYTRAHSQMSHHLRTLTKEIGSSFSRRMQDTGEQRLMSMLIEPVQRLPRYNLYIDNILKQLPGRHAAVNGLLKARDLISEICSQDASDALPDQVQGRLKALVASWPPQLQLRGRLITAVDAVELPAPYRQHSQEAPSSVDILVLFTDQLIILRKASMQSLAARGLLAQLDGTDIMRNDVSLGDLTFKESISLDAVDATELDGGKFLQLVPVQDSSRVLVGPRRPGSSRPGSQSASISIRVYQTTGAYDAKVGRFCEEIVHARVEGRFTEAERESHKWEARTCATSDLSFFSAVSEDQSVDVARSSPARIRVVIDAPNGAEIIRPGTGGVEVAAILSTISDGFFKLELSGLNDFSSKDNLTTKEFLPVLAKRLNNYLQMKNQIRNPSMTEMLLLRNQTILQSLQMTVDEQRDPATKERASRPPSPVKLLSNFFGGGSVREPNQIVRRHNTARSEVGLGEIPVLRPSQASRPSSRDLPAKPITPAEVVSAAADALARLEETLGSYILALQARKGNIVSRILRTRGGADELAVNELYNALLENPANYEVVAQSSIDVLFCAFEKFIKIAWHDKIGPIISPSMWTAIQSKLDSQYPGDFEDFFRNAVNDLAPQNQRALRACIKLLVELLEGTGNDGDRGMITANFAEILTPEGNPSDFVSVLDRLVEDVDPLLNNNSQSNLATPHGSVSDATIHRPKGFNSSSLTSNTSLRKKFGFSSFSRKGSKTQEDDKSESGSTWKSLGKATRTEDKSNSLSKAASPISRSNSVDVATTMGFSPKRPVSRDRPSVLGAFTFENSPLATIGEAAPIGLPRKKRRSSLSDLNALQASRVTSPNFSPMTPSAKRSLLPGPSPLSPSPLRPSLLPTPGSAKNKSSPLQREDSPIRGLPRPLNVRKNSTPSQISDEVIISSVQSSSHRRNKSSASGIPTLGSLKSPPQGLSERPTSGNVRKLPLHPLSTGSPEKPMARLRMQSPQKLRERVQTNQKNFESAGASFQEEMAKIAEEIRSSRSAGADAAALLPLQSKLTALSASHTSMMADVKVKLDGLSKDVASSLQVSESRYKKLDELYKDTSAENELLYSRFNDELAKIMGQVRRGEGADELKKRLVESQDEIARLRKENQRLRRENGGLKAQLRE